MKLVKRVIIFLGTFMLYHIVFSSFFPADENNVLIAPDWYTYLGLGIATIVALSFNRKKKTTHADNNRSNPDSLINYLRGASADIPLDRNVNIEATSVKSRLDHPRISPQKNPELDLMTIDQMEGHEFEYWCASLLRKIGFINVFVTQGSGDQGVDVLAEKDGIRYAVQCKCYSKDLGNKPVQEVNSGKLMPEYRCQIGAVMTNRHFTKGAKDLAAATGTLLWDRDWIEAQLRALSSSTIAAPMSHSSAINYDHLIERAVDVLMDAGYVHSSILEQKLGLDHTESDMVLQALEDQKLVTHPDGRGFRTLLITQELWNVYRKK